jgi:hypothetical protein
MLQFDPNLISSPSSNATAAVAASMTRGLGQGQLWDVTSSALYRPTDVPTDLDFAATLNVNIQFGGGESMDLDGLRVGYYGASESWWVGGQDASVSQDTQIILAWNTYYQFVTCFSGYSGCIRYQDQEQHGR